MLAAGSQRPDVCIATTGLGRRMYVENKLDATLTPAQEQGYPAIRGHALLAVMPASRDGENLPDEFRRLTWTQVARAAYTIGTEWADDRDASPKDWREHARRFDTPAEYRFLAELTWYLERELSVPAGAPIQPDDAGVIARADGALTRWDELARLPTAALGENPVWLGATHRNGAADRFHAELPVPPGSHAVGWSIELEGRWPAFETAHQNTPEGEDPGSAWALASVLMDYIASWIGPSGYAIGPAAIGAGMTVGIVDGDWPWGLRDTGPPLGQALRLEAVQRGFSFGTTWKNEVGRVFKTKLLSQIPPAATLEEQADHVIRWIRDVLAEIEGIGSGDTTLPSAPTWSPPEQE